MQLVYHQPMGMMRLMGWTPGGNFAMALQKHMVKKGNLVAKYYMLQGDTRAAAGSVPDVSGLHEKQREL